MARLEEILRPLQETNITPTLSQGSLTVVTGVDDVQSRAPAAIRQEESISDHSISFRSLSSPSDIGTPRTAAQQLGIESRLDTAGRRASLVAPEEGHSPQDKMLAILDLNRYFRKNRGVGRQRQAVLEAAIALAEFLNLLLQDNLKLYTVWFL
jgi:hypothetical protein